MQAQQYQFWKEMRIQEAKRAQSQAKTEESKKGCRFVDDYRPMTLCRHMKERGQCARGETCVFAHNFEELHVISPDLPKVAGDKTDSGTGFLAASQGTTAQAPELKMKKKKDLCDRFARGECLLGKV